MPHTTEETGPSPITSIPTSIYDPGPVMTVTVLAAPKTKTETRTKEREPLREIDMAASQAQTRSASGGASGSARGRGGRSSARLNKGQEQGGEEVNMNGVWGKRKAGE